jgi:hypothetical protein
MKIATSDNALPNLSGGYITKADKSNADDPVAWTMSSYIGTNDVAYIHVQPKPEDVTAQQNSYIQSDFQLLESTASTGNTSLINGYPSLIDIPSFVDFMLISELSANADAYQFSTYFHKDRNGKLNAGPIWDNNLTFGNDLFIWGFDRSKTDTWQFANGDNIGSKFWKDLFTNPQFKCYLSKRWNQLTQPGQPLNSSVIEALMDKTIDTISEASVRENIKWGTESNISAEISNMKVWLKQRTAWLTANLGPYTDCSNVATPSLVITKIMYNPAVSVDFPISNDQEFIEIQNTGNKTVDLTGVYFSGTGFVYQFPAYSEILPGSSKILASIPSVFMAKFGIAPSGQFTRNLSNKGEKLVLADAFGNVIDSVSYSNLPPWPNADGNGSYLQVIDPYSDNSVPSNWIASTNTITAVGETEINTNLKFYPTPVNDNLSIEYSGTIKNVELLDIQGKSIRKIDLNSGNYKLDMSSCSTGIYLIRVVTPEGSFMKKIIKN